MNYNHRLDQIKLLVVDVRLLANTHGLAVGLNKVKPCELHANLVKALAAVMKEYDIKGDEHLKRNEKEPEIPAGPAAAGRGAPWIEETDAVTKTVPSPATKSQG